MTKEKVQEKLNKWRKEREELVAILNATNGAIKAFEELLAEWDQEEKSQ